MPRAIVLTVILALLPVAQPVAAADYPPRTIRVFISHKRGSPIPAHIVKVSLKTYVSRVMNGGAWPAYKPIESLKVGAIAIKQYAVWHIRHPQPGYTWRGQRYDIRDGDQLYRRPFKSHSKTWYAIESTWNVQLRKRGRLFRTGWRGGSGKDGWHLYEDTVSRLARWGHPWRVIIRAQLSPVEIRLVW
jgi:hypothetical protein